MQLFNNFSLIAGLVAGVLSAENGTWMSEQWDAIIVGAGPAGIVGMSCSCV